MGKKEVSLQIGLYSQYQIQEKYHSSWGILSIAILKYSFPVADRCHFYHIAGFTLIQGGCYLFAIDECSMQLFLHIS
jgi:hypothetical protein